MPLSIFLQPYFLKDEIDHSFRLDPSHAVMRLDFAITKVAPDAGQIVFSQDMVMLADGHPLFFDSGAHKGNGWNVEGHGAVQRSRIIADKEVALREEGKKFPDIPLNEYTNRMTDLVQNILHHDSICGPTK